MKMWKVDLGGDSRGYVGGGRLRKEKDGLDTLKPSFGNDCETDKPRLIFVLFLNNYKKISLNFSHNLC